MSSILIDQLSLDYFYQGPLKAVYSPAADVKNYSTVRVWVGGDSGYLNLTTPIQFELVGFFGRKGFNFIYEKVVTTSFTSPESVSEGEYFDFPVVGETFNYRITTLNAPVFDPPPPPPNITIYTATRCFEGAPTTEAQESIGGNVGSGAEVFIPVGNNFRTLVSGDSSVTITQTATEIDLMASLVPPPGGGPYEQVGGIISPVSLGGTSAISCGLDNVIGAGGNGLEFIAGGSNNSMVYGAPAGDSCCIVGSEGSMVISVGTRQSGIYSSNAGVVNRGRNQSALLATQNCQYTNVGGSGGGSNCVMAACLNCTIDDSGNGSKRQSAIIGGSSIRFDGNYESSVIVGGSDHVVDNNGGNFGRNNFIGGGQNCQLLNNRSNVVAFVSGPTIFNIGASNTFFVKNTGGSRFYSNDSATIGVNLAPGSNSWAAVSDMNKKENLVEVDYSSTMDKVKTLPIYNYNFIGRPQEQCNIGPMAQDWHDSSRFLCGDVPKLDDDDQETVILDEVTGEPIMVPAKDPLLIEILDMVGVALACIKNLNSRIEVLEATLS